MKFYTAQIAQWRAVDALGIQRLDITAKSGIKAFAPAFEDVMRYKRGELTEFQYTEIYHDRMMDSQKRFPRMWSMLLEGPEQKCLLCYCGAGKFCHRHLLMDIADWYLSANGVAFQDMGEITKGGIIVARWSKLENKDQE